MTYHQTMVPLRCNESLGTLFNSNLCTSIDAISEHASLRAVEQSSEKALFQIQTENFN